ncbi:MAG TPA: dTDP-4-dehydrorhamnose reductase [Vicinamibacterales bacterium]|nr:dTDP-4-dehydrorhamnose reductase [Vicinamibacterales bacterium]
MRIAVFGARGQLGAAVTEECAPLHDTTTFARADLDIADERGVLEAMSRLRPDAIVNGIAYTDVDGAEDHAIEALNANAFAVRTLARAAAAVGAVLVHYSTDFVFDGKADAPYTEADRPNPRSVYAASKLLGEWFANDAPRSYVLRVETLFGRTETGPVPRGSVANIVNALTAGGNPKVFEDRTVSPTYLADAARATRLLLESLPPAGLYHCVNSGHATWLEFASELARRLGGDALVAKLVPVRMADVKLRAIRPQFCALANAKLRSAGIEMPAWQDALARYLSGGVASALHRVSVLQNDRGSERR